jgi:hypothetical protein
VFGFERARLRGEPRLIDERPHARLQQVRADVEEQQETRDEKERDDQQPGHEPDEDVGQDQFAADAPQQSALRPHHALGNEVAGDEDEREAPDGIDDVEKRPGAWEQRADHRDVDFDGRAHQQYTAGETAQQPMAQRVRTRRGVAGQHPSTTLGTARSIVEGRTVRRHLPSNGKRDSL